MVAPALLAGGIAGAGDIIGAGLNYMGAEDAISSSNEANKWNLAQRQAEFNKNVQMEYDFAQNGLSWRIADAAKNGISPLAAIGASGPSFSPVIGVGEASPVDTGAGLRALGSGVASAGQDVSRALIATKSKEEKAAEALDLARRSKENDLLDVQIANAKFELARNSMSGGIPLAYESRRNLDGSVSTVPTHGGEFLGPAIWSVHNKLIPAMQPSALDLRSESNRGVEVPSGVSVKWLNY